tara:strand:- start:1908 stop:3965 length:2058 start_codon:yes stop_codon:yes gene_type:complete
MTTKIPVELSSTPGIVDNSNATAITIDSSENVSLTGQITIGSGNNIINAGNMTVDVAGDITLDADGGDIKLSNGGTQFANFGDATGAIHIDAVVSDDDIKFRGNDGGSVITALTLDMSDAGTATFNNGVTLSNELSINGTGTAQLKINGATSSESILRFYDGGSESWMLRQTNSDNVLSFRRNSNNYLSLSASGVVSTVGDVTVGGNLTVQGTTTTLNTATLDVEDKNITLNAGSGDTSGSADGAGITIQDAVDASTDASLTWRASDDKFIFSHSLRMFNNLELPDNIKLIAGDGNDLQIYHDGSNSIIFNQTGRLDLRGAHIGIRNAANSEYMIQAIENGAVELYYDNAKKLETTSGGVSVTGNIANASGDMTIDVAGDIFLDADGAGIYLSDAGTSVGRFLLSSSDLTIGNLVSDKDIKFTGSDGGSAVTALTLDMSLGGTAIFNHDIEMPDAGLLRMGAGGDLILTSDGTNGTIFTNNGNLTLDSTGDIILDADGSDITLKDGGVEIGNISLASSNLMFTSSVQDKDILFTGNDGGSPITALTLDMSDAGTATFNNAINVTGDLKFNSGYGSSVTGYGVRAWVNFNGTGTVAIREDGNVSSITDNGTGDYTVNFATALPDTNYCVVGSGISVSNHPAVGVSVSSASGAQATGSIRIVVSTTGGAGSVGQSTDGSIVSVAVIR